MIRRGQKELFRNCHLLRRRQIPRPTVIRTARIVQVDGSGTAVNESMPEDGPPGIAAMVNVAPLPRVTMFCATAEAIKLVPAENAEQAWVAVDVRRVQRDSVEKMADAPQPAFGLLQRDTAD